MHYHLKIFYIENQSYIIISLKIYYFYSNYFKSYTRSDVRLIDNINIFTLTIYQN